MSERDLRDRLEAAEHELIVLREARASLAARVASLEAELAQALAEQERLARELVHHALNPHAQKTDFTPERVAELMAFLKSGR